MSTKEESVSEDLKKEWIKLAAGKKRLAIANIRFLDLIQLLLENREKLDTRFPTLKQKSHKTERYT